VVERPERDDHSDALSGECWVGDSRDKERCGLGLFLLGPSEWWGVGVRGGAAEQGAVGGDYPHRHVRRGELVR
jgi:hypothetical protein